jgi:hypothetical protein
MRRRRNSPGSLEADLRALRTPARRTFTGTLAAYVRERSVRERRRPLGLALALALTGAIVVSLAAVGGLGYAASASKRSAVAVGHVVSPALKTERSAARQTPAQAQYQVTICHRTGVRSRPWAQLSVNTTTVKTYLARGDFIVTPATPCPPATRVACSVGSIVGRRIAVSCTAGTVRAGKSCSLKVRKTIVSRGTVGKNGKYSARFNVATPLTRGTRIFFLVGGKTLTSVSV